MTRIGRRLIEDFLIPALNEEKYGELLKWIDEEKQTFYIRWSHKNAAKWSLEDTTVFQEWDKLKGHYRPQVRGYFMQAKQRFRAALYKLSSVKRLPCEDKTIKKYQLILDDKKKSENAGKRVRMPKCQKSIPTPVICKNTTYIDRQDYSSLPRTLPSPVSSIKREPPQTEDEYVYFEYSSAQHTQMQRQRHSSSGDLARIEESPPRDMGDSPVLRENSLPQRTPHVPVPTPPLYSSSLRQFYGCAQKRVESPWLLVAKTYNDVEENDPSVEVDINMHGVEDSEPSSDGALNLSVKSDDSENLSR